MAHCKFNRLHLHASDAQSWLLEVPSLPDLAIEGAYDPSQIWSVEDLREVKRHGQLRGIEFYLEIDVPGHTTSIAASRPNLVSSAYREPWLTYAAEPPPGQLALNSSEVMAFELHCSTTSSHAMRKFPLTFTLVEMKSMLTSTVSALTHPLPKTRSAPTCRGSQIMSLP
jgi:hypothetical protein